MVGQEADAEEVDAMMDYNLATLAIVGLCFSIYASQYYYHAKMKDGARIYWMLADFATLSASGLCMAVMALQGLGVI